MMRNVIYAAMALALVLLADMLLTLLAGMLLTAAAWSETPVFRIRIGDLDLRGDNGRAALNARTDVAADRFCMRLAQGRIPLLSGEQACREGVRLEIAEHLGALQLYGPVLAAALTQSPP